MIDLPQRKQHEHSPLDLTTLVPLQIYQLLLLQESAASFAGRIVPALVLMMPSRSLPGPVLVP